MGRQSERGKLTKANLKFRSGRYAIDETYKLIREIQSSLTPQDICKGLLAYAGRFGATNILAGTLPLPRALPREQISHIILDAWPTEWSQRYFSRGYIDNDPTIRLVSRRTPVFLWSQVHTLCEASLLGQQIMNEAADFRLREGLTSAFSTLEGHAVGFSIAGECLHLDPSERQALQLCAAYSFCCAVALASRKRDRAPVSLSPRQHEALLWASEGWNVDEIGDRMTISSHTADMHLRAVREKLGVTSSIHAVAEGLRLGLIN